MAEPGEAASAADIESAKAALRAAALEKRARLPADYCARAALEATEHFFREVPLRQGQTIAVFWPIRGEIDTRPLLTRLMDEMHSVCLPVVTGPDRPLVFRRWELGAPLYPAGIGTLEPDEAAPPATPDLIVMPLLGFDRLGTRLGYGGAYYDRTLAALENRPVLIGFAYAAQEIDSIARELHDIPLDMVVTEQGAVRFTGVAP